MAVNKLMKEVEAERAESLSALMAISRDLEAYLAGPKELSVRIGPKYERVDGRKGSTSALDKEYRDALKSFTPVSLGRVFGPNKDLVAVARDVRDELKSVYGASRGLATYVDTATQAIMQVLISGAYSVPDRDGFTYLESAKDFLVEESKKVGGVTGALKELNTKGSPRFEEDSATTSDLVSLFKGDVFRFLTPLSYEHLKQLEAKYLPKLQSREVMEDYIANAQAQLAASRYITTRAPADNVLLPQAISGNTQSDVQNAMLQYGKDVVATFNYYKAAVEAEFDMSSGVQTGQVEAALKGASRALKSAGDAVRLTGALPAVIKDIKSEFNSIARDISSIKLKEAAQAQYDISMAYAKIVHALGEDKGSSLVKGGLASTVKGILDTLDVASDFGFQDEAYEDSLEDIRPTSLSLRGYASIPAIADFQEAVSSALGLLNVAYEGLVSVGLRGITSSGAPVAPPIKRPAVTDEFKTLARAQMNDVFAALKTVARDDEVNEVGYKAGIMAAFADIFGIRGFFNTLDFAPSGGTANPLTDMKITQIADGRLPTLSTRTVGGQTIKERMLSVARTAAGTSAKRRQTAGALTQSIDLVLESLNGLRVQAESIGMRIRQNPAFSRGERVKNALMYGGGSLVGNHAISAGINKFVAPESGSALAYLTTYGSSVATIGAAVKMAEDEETRNDIIVGAGLHMAARAALTFFPAARFSNNIFAKILQAPTSGVANIIGDQSLAASALTPVNLEAHKDELAAYVLTLVKTNNVKTLPYIAVQLANAGLVLTNAAGSGGSANNIALSVRDTHGDIENLFLLHLKCILKDAKAVEHVKAEKNTLSLPDDEYNKAFYEAHSAAFNKTVNEYAEATKDLKSTKKAVAAPTTTTATEETARTNGLGQFILEPGYDMDVYSAADHASYLQPAPIQTSQSGFAQLENAINRARRLSNREKAQEGISDMSHIDIIRATPKTVRMAEKAGMGTSLGQSRSNPNHELLALEVQGANGLWPVSPARQRSVPQGALNYTKIGHAPDIAVSPHGLFNKGAFTPSFGG